jgi:hypothetical protein
MNPQAKTSMWPGSGQAQFLTDLPPKGNLFIMNDIGWLGYEEVVFT